MEGVRFHEGELTSGYSFGFEESLFNLSSHRELQSKTNWHSFYILNELTKKVSASIHFHISDQAAQSPVRAPFGSLEFEDIPKEILLDFLRFIERQLLSKNVTSITIKNYPIAYQNDNASRLEALLSSLSYQNITSEISSVIDVSENDVTKRFTRSHPKQFEKGQREGLIVKELHIERLNDVYHFIEQCRRAKGYALSMSFDQLLQTVNVFPTRFKLFAVLKDEEIVAASIAIRVRTAVLYEFYHDHDAVFDYVSPVVTLVSGIYKFCFNEGITLFDLGTSALNGHPNFGLLQFKQNLGGRPTLKNTFHKVLSP